jgi:(R,R)-butanediol dehydrogenase / meso-butanediol dehydrogenase / diacetyl reductase
MTFTNLKVCVQRLSRIEGLFKMTATRFHGVKDIRIEQIPMPTTTSGHALIDVEWCGLCGTDLHKYPDGPFLIPPTGIHHALTGEHMLVVMRHEFCGRIRQLPDGYGGTLAVGQPVMVNRQSTDLL